MSAFSASDAALEGFQMLRTHWRVVVGWAVFNLLALVAMIVITVILGCGNRGLAAGVDPGVPGRRAPSAVSPAAW